MSISDKTRKMLWGKSGNRCSICKIELVVEAIKQDVPSVIGEECHIISGQTNGPRYDSNFNKEMIDSYDNLILLCRVHHKMIDDQKETYTADILKQMKSNHEKWVSTRLGEQEKKFEPMKIRRIEENIPDVLPQIFNGKDIISIIDGALGYQFDHDELQSEKHLELISGFFQYIQDLGDLLSEFESGERVKHSYELTRQINELKKHDYYVFGAREVRILEGGRGEPINFPIAIINTRHKDSSEILKINLDKRKE
ncbi:HNH endonuclease signature motif containing protein [Paenibacillus terrae]|uniref:HNH endonuclease signature motif containing protein n=1 Tax=Paenibacillus terrae TaxID=159743 RepID=UPI0011EAFBE2|nr:HNH endonuclease signature motif containing protein [Paenibacillus terrae]